MLSTAAARWRRALFVEVLAKELGARGVTVNSILPTVTAGAGLSTDEVRPQAHEFIRTFNPMQRRGDCSGTSPTPRNIWPAIYRPL